MSSMHNSWNLGLSGTTQTRHGPRFLGVLNLFLRQQLVFRDIDSRDSRATGYGYPIEIARTSIVLPLAFLQMPMDGCAYIEHVLAHFRVDHWYRSSFATRILRAARGLSRLHPHGFRMTVILDQISEVEDLAMREVMEQLDSESGSVMRGASKSAILGLKEMDYAAEDRERCSICLEDFNRENKVTKLPCSHLFHRPCIVQWLESNNSCPLCRCELDT